MSRDTNPADQKPPAEDRFAQLWRRLKDHRIAQWTVGYVAVAYGIQHAVILTSESFEWPNIVARISMLALILALPLAITFAWYHGERTTRRVSGGELSIISLLLVVISILFFVLARPAEEARTAAATTQAGATASAAPAPTGANGISVAVLPFVNLSSDKEQEFFSDGITEEITAALAQVKGLRVVGRTSAFAFKGQNKDLRAVGQALGATHVIEGSVRKAGNRLRITAQLVKTDDDSHLWAQNYDRELNDVFAIQEDIAQAIAVSLQVPLGLKQGETLVANRAIESDAYQNYLRAKALLRARGKGPLNEAAGLLETVVARSPNYAPAWAALSEVYVLIPAYDLAAFSGPAADLRQVASRVIPKAEAAARKAIELDPKLPDGYAALGAIDDGNGKPAIADEMFNRALLLDPNNPDAQHFYALMLAETGHEKRALEMRLRLRQLEPLVPVFNWNLAGLFLIAGQTDAALAMNKEMAPDTLAFGRETFASINASAGQYRQAADMLESIPGDQADPEVTKAAARLLRAAPAKAASSAALPGLGSLSWVYLFVGAQERLLDYYERNIEAGYNFGLSAQTIWDPMAAPLRKTERFKTFVRSAGYVDYWRAKGWPDLCHPVGADDFACE